VSKPRRRMCQPVAMTDSYSKLRHRVAKRNRPLSFTITPQSNMSKLSIIVPVFNEEENVMELHSRILEVCRANLYDCEIIFVDDGSTDGTREALRRLSPLKYIRLRQNSGQTAAMMAGIDHATGDILIPMDGDMQNDPSDIPRLLAKLDEGYDVVSGWRKNRKDYAIKRNLVSRVANMLISRISGVPLHDYGCSLKAYRSNIIKDVKLYGEMHRFIPIYATWQGGRVSEIEVTHHARKFGKSKYGLERTLKVVLDLIVIKFLQKYSESSIYLFGGFGVVNLALSVFCFLLMIYFKLWGGKSFIETPLPQLVVLFFIVGFQSILMGLIAEMLNRTYHESQRKPVYAVKELIDLR
jgi:glycosyltransferase involved in cell wall biosynthesis